MLSSSTSINIQHSQQDSQVCLQNTSPRQATKVAKRTRIFSKTRADTEPGRGSTQQLLGLVLSAGCTSHRPAPTAQGVDFPAFHSGNHLFIPVLWITSKAQLNPCCTDINHLAQSHSSRSAWPFGPTVGGRGDS